MCRTSSQGSWTRVHGLTTPLVTLISLSLILSSMFVEWVDYRRIHLEPSLIVDRSRGEKLIISMDITFPRVPCYCEWERAFHRVATLSSSHLPELQAGVPNKGIAGMSLAPQFSLGVANANPSAQYSRSMSWTSLANINQISSIQ